MVVWERAHRFALDLYVKTKGFPRDEMFGLTSQMRRSATSIGSNLAEGCGRRADGELCRFVQIAMGSAAELDYQLLMAKDLKYLDAKEYSRFHTELTEIRRMLSALYQTVKQSIKDSK